MKEKISADHLLYVSLKYTKTCDVMINLLIRWRYLMELSFERILKHAKKKKIIKIIPNTPVAKIQKIREIFKKKPEVLEAIDLYEMAKKIEQVRKSKEHEFRKNVTLKVIYKGKEIAINLDKLKEYAKTIDNFVKETKEFLNK